MTKQTEALGYCCYGGKRARSACASCAAWQPLPQLPPPEALALANEAKRLADNYMLAGCGKNELHDAINRLAALAQQPDTRTLIDPALPDGVAQEKEA